MDRRMLLKTGGLAALSFGLNGCASRSAPKASPERSPRRPPVNLAPVNVAWDRIIRTTVGLRPHRPTGFVVRADRLDGKTVVHNYGHGGAGHSLAWGTALLATELALAHDDRRAAVIGCGAVGLATARQLQRHGFEATIYAASVPPDTTSSWALAGFTPVSGLVSAAHTPEWDTQFTRAVEIGYRQLQLLSGGRYGVSWLDNYNPTDEPPAASGASGMLPASLQLEHTVLGPGEHPFPTKYAVRTPFLRIEPSIYLDALMHDVVAFGGRIVVRRFDALRDLMALNEPLIVNCTGLGSRELFGDQELVPLKGQLTLLVPQAEVQYGTQSRGPAGGGGGIGIHMLPRGDGIALGGTSERGVWTLEPNEEARTRIVGAHKAMFDAMRPPVGRATQTTSAAPERAPGVEQFFGLTS